jgi:outer membrane protein TolC
VRVRSVVSVLPAILLLAACAVTPDPLTDAERADRIAADRAAIAEMAPLTDARIDLYDAMARAIAFNLTHRQRLLETAIAAGIADVQSYDMLPRLAASAGLSRRTNDYATISRDLSTGVTDETYSTSVDRTQATGSLKLSWTVLDFGVSYLQAHQNADRMLIAREKRRKAVQTILRDVQSAWLRAVVAERLSRDLMPLQARVERALTNARIIEEQRLLPPMEALDAQRQLLSVLRTLQELKRELVGARSDLARLLNIPPGTPFEIDTPTDLTTGSALESDLSALIARALRDRPELREEDYQARIGADETRKAILRMLPGLELSLGANWDDNSFLKNATWADAGLFLAWNLMNLVSGPANIALAEQREDAAHLRRLALHMAVAAQVAVAWEQLQVAGEAVDLSERIYDVDERIFGQAVAGAETAVQTEVQLIRADAARLASAIRRDMAYVGREEALAALRVSIGDDPLPWIDAIEDADGGADGGPAALRAALMAWHRAPGTPPESAPGPAVWTGDGPPPAKVEWTIESSQDPAVPAVPAAPALPAPSPSPAPAPSFSPSPSDSPSRPAEVEWIIETTNGPQAALPRLCLHLFEEGDLCRDLEPL